MRKEKSDEMFLKWSKGRNEHSWDIQFVAEQIRIRKLDYGLDIGGGIGTFSNAIINLNNNIQSIDVVDPSELAHLGFVENSKINLIKGYMSDISSEKSYEFITANLVCHHIISNTNKDTFDAQVSFLKHAHTILKPGGVLFVEENIYESYFLEDISGRLIYEITSLRLFEKIIRKLGANTAGEGVRFHSDQVWRKIFAKAGFKIVQTHDDLSFGDMPLWQEILLLSKFRYQRIYVLEKRTMQMG